MLDQLIADYLTAMRNRATARAAFDEMTGRVKTAADAMAAAKKSVEPGGQVLMHGGYGVTRDVVDPAEWPAAAAVNQTWQSLLSAATHAERAWSNIPADRRAGLLPPDAK